MTHEDQWCGKPLSEMSREELMEAVRVAARMLEISHTQAIHEIGVLGRTALYREVMMTPFSEIMNGPIP